MNTRAFLRRVLFAGLALCTLPVPAAGEPDFSWMTLNGITRVAAVADGIPADLVAYGLLPATFEARARERLAQAGIAVISLDEARRTAGAAKLRLRLVANRDPYGIYYFGMKVELRQKIPLGNPAGGFVSQVVWSDGESGTMQYDEFEKPLTAMERVLDRLIADHRAQNP
jgi:hypothetical protein